MFDLKGARLTDDQIEDVVEEMERAPNPLRKSGWGCRPLVTAAENGMARHIVEHARNLRYRWDTMRQDFGTYNDVHLLERMAALSELIGGIEAALEREE